MALRSTVFWEILGENAVRRLKHARVLCFRMDGGWFVYPFRVVCRRRYLQAPMSMYQHAPMVDVRVGDFGFEIRWCEFIGRDGILVSPVAVYALWWDVQF